MKKKICHAISIVCAVLLFVFFLGLGVIKYCIVSYGSGAESMSDVIKVNTGTEYIILSDDGNIQRFLAAGSWNCFSEFEKYGYHHTDTMGTGTFYENDNGERICLVATNQWCKLFREYTVHGINCTKKIQDILSD